jgi:predicted NBD/HSP70 family sugar kinase
VYLQNDILLFARHVKQKDEGGMKLSIRTATPSSVRVVNRSILLNLIRRHQPVSRADLARLTGIFRSSVSDIVDELIAEKLLTEERAAASQRGRVPISLRLNDSSYPVLGLNIRPAYCQIARAGLNGQIHKNLVFKTPTSPDKLVRAVAEAVERLGRPGKNTARAAFRCIGIAVPGHVDSPKGRILWTPTHKELSDFPIADEIRTYTGIEAKVDNDCNVGALSELWLSPEEEKDRIADFVFLNVSDFGTGAGTVMKGEVYLGHDAHFAAEVGHMVVDPSGPLCTCGRRGCWEVFVNNSATWHRVHPRSPFSVDGFEEMLAAAKRGDARSFASFRETAKYLSLGISNIGFAFNPAKVIIAGRITEIWDLIREDVETKYGSPHLRSSIYPARLSADDSLLHGAVCLALSDTFARPKFGEISGFGRHYA